MKNLCLISIGSDVPHGLNCTETDKQNRELLTMNETEWTFIHTQPAIAVKDDKFDVVTMG